MATLRRVAADRAVMLVTHRMDTLEPTDEIVVLEAGRIVQRGRHAELIAAPGLYRRLVGLYRAEAVRAEEIAAHDVEVAEHEAEARETIEDEIFMPPASTLGGVMPGVGL